MIPVATINRVGRAPEPVQTITTAGTSLSDEQRGRMRRYLISMAIRTVCFIGAVIAPSPWRWVLLGGAVLLPYFAVVMANAGGDRQSETGMSILRRRVSGAIEGPRG